MKNILKKYNIDASENKSLLKPTKTEAQPKILDKLLSSDTDKLSIV